MEAIRCDPRILRPPHPIVFPAESSHEPYCIRLILAPSEFPHHVGRLPLPCEAVDFAQELPEKDACRVLLSPNVRSLPLVQTLARKAQSHSGLHQLLRDRPQHCNRLL